MLVVGGEWLCGWLSRERGVDGGGGGVEMGSWARKVGWRGAKWRAWIDEARKSARHCE